MQQKAGISSTEEPMDNKHLLNVYYVQDISIDSWDSIKKEQSIILALQET